MLIQNITGQGIDYKRRELLLMIQYSDQVPTACEHSRQPDL